MSAASGDQHQNGAVPSGPLPDIQENEPLNPPQPSEVKVTIRENPLKEQKPPMVKRDSRNESIQVNRKKKTVRKPREKFLISTCIILSSCVIILLVLLICQTYFSGECRSTDAGSFSECVHIYMQLNIHIL